MDQEKQAKRDKVVQLFREMTAGAAEAAEPGKRKANRRPRVLSSPERPGTHIINSTIVVCGGGCQDIVAQLLGKQRAR